jgi:hypothetical protein
MVAQRPSWETYAVRLGDNEFDHYGVAHRMLSLFRAPFYARSNPEALARFEAVCAAAEARMTPAELEAVRRWQDPHVHVGGLRPITSMVGEALLRAGEHEQADRLLSIAAGQVPRYSIWRMEFAWKALQARQHLRAEPLPQDLAWARAMIDDGETFLAVTRTTPSAMRRYLGLAYNLLDLPGPAVEHLGEAIRAVHSAEGLEVLHALVDSLVKTQQRDQARRLLQMPVRDPVLQTECKRLLEQLDARRQ